MARSPWVSWLALVASCGSAHGGDGTDGTEASSAGAGSSTDEAATGSTEGDAATTSTTGDADTTAAASDGSSAVCGNAVVEPGEHCDGEDVLGVPCPVDCRFPSGFELWATTFDGNGGNSPLSSNDHPLAVAAADDAIVVVGSLGTVDNGDAGLVARLSRSGELQWMVGHVAVVRHAGQHRATGVVIDRDVVLVTGIASRSVWTAGFDAFDGTLLDQDIVVGPNPDSDYLPGNPALRPDGTIVVVGASDFPSDAPGFILSYDPLGTAPTVEWFSGPEYAPGFSQLAGLQGVVTDDDQLLVTGLAFQPGGDAWMQRRTFDGDVLWGVTDGDNGSAFTRAALLPDGSFAVAMDRRPEATADEAIWVGRYDPSGKPRWSEMWSSEPGTDATPAGVAADEQGRVYVLGTIADDTSPSPAGRDYDMVVLAYDAEGNQLWEDIYSGQGMGGGEYSWDYARAITIDPDGFIVTTGCTMTPTNQYDVIVRVLAP